MSDLPAGWLHDAAVRAEAWLRAQDRAKLGPAAQRLLNALDTEERCPVVDIRTRERIA